MATIKRRAVEGRLAKPQSRTGFIGLRSQAISPNSDQRVM
jgi:hypothetical protein